MTPSTGISIVMRDCRQPHYDLSLTVKKQHRGDRHFGRDPLEEEKFCAAVPEFRI